MGDSFKSPKSFPSLCFWLFDPIFCNFQRHHASCCHPLAFMWSVDRWSRGPLGVLGISLIWLSARLHFLWYPWWWKWYPWWCVWYPWWLEKWYPWWWMVPLMVKVVPLMVNSSFKTNHVRRVPVFSDQIDGCACGILFCHSGARSCTLLDCILLVGCDYSCDSWALIFEILMLRRLCCFKNSLSSQQFKYLY